MADNFADPSARRPPNLVAVIDQDGLRSLIERLARLRLELEKVERGPGVIDSAKKAGYDEDSAKRVAAAEQLLAVLSFLEDSESLAPELHHLLNALLDIERGHPVAWLQPAKKKGRPPLSFMDASQRARYAWIMDFLIEKGGKSEKEAADLVVEHAGLRRWLRDRGRRNSADPWRVVANWRDRIKGGSCTEEERIAFAETAEIANTKLDSPQDVEREARKLLRAIKIYFSRG